MTSFTQFWKRLYEKRVHVEDRKIMIDFIDYARTNKPISDSKYRDAERLAGHYGISMDRGLRGVANSFESLL